MLTADEERALNQVRAQERLRRKEVNRKRYLRRMTRQLAAERARTSRRVCA